jgi:hypothetical protein
MELSAAESIALNWKRPMRPFGPNLGNCTLIVPLAGLILLLLVYSGMFADIPTVERGAIQVGVALFLLGVIFAGLFGHVIWLVPFAWLLLWPMIAWGWMVEAIESRRRRR